MSYHPYVSDSRVHDQAFVKLAMIEMTQSMDVPDDAVIVIESDTCSGQYKPSHHFTDMQHLANKFNHTVIRVFDIADHGKGEVDHVGGAAKVAVRQQIARELFTSAWEVHETLKKKIGEKDHLKYHIHQLSTDELENERQTNVNTVFKTIAGSASFEIMIFKPNSEVFKASSRLCICTACQVEYGSCSLFKKIPVCIPNIHFYKSSFRCPATYPN